MVTGVVAAESLAQEIGEDHLEKRQLYPAFSEIRDISAHIGAAVAAKAYDLGIVLISVPLLQYNLLTNYQ